MAVEGVGGSVALLATRQRARVAPRALPSPAGAGLLVLRINLPRVLLLLLQLLQLLLVPAVILFGTTFAEIVAAAIVLAAIVVPKGFCCGRSSQSSESAPRLRARPPLSYGGGGMPYAAPGS